MSDSVHDNKTITRRVIEEVISKGRFDLIDEVISQDFITHGPGLPEEGLRGPSGYRRWLEELRLAFPDIEIRVEDQIAEEDKVVCRVTARATHSAEYMGIPATGRTFLISGIVIYQLHNGKLARYWLEQDNLSLVTQLTE